MTDSQNHKAMILSYYRDLEAASPDGVEKVII